MKTDWRANNKANIASSGNVEEYDELEQSIDELLQEIDEDGQQHAE